MAVGFFVIFVCDCCVCCLPAIIGACHHVAFVVGSRWGLIHFIVVATTFLAKVRWSVLGNTWKWVRPEGASLAWGKSVWRSVADKSNARGGNDSAKGWGSWWWEYWVWMEERGGGDGCVNAVKGLSVRINLDHVHVLDYIRSGCIKLNLGRVQTQGGLEHFAKKLELARKQLEHLRQRRLGIRARMTPTVGHCNGLIKNGAFFRNYQHRTLRQTSKHVIYNIKCFRSIRSFSLDPYDSLQ